MQDGRRTDWRAFNYVVGVIAIPTIISVFFVVAPQRWLIAAAAAVLLIVGALYVNELPKLVVSRTLDDPTRPGPTPGSSGTMLPPSSPRSSNNRGAT
jgi:hypothetical protein